MVQRSSPNTKREKTRAHRRTFSAHADRAQHDFIEDWHISPVHSDCTWAYQILLGIYYMHDGNQE